MWRYATDPRVEARHERCGVTRKIAKKWSGAATAERERGLHHALSSTLAFLEQT